MSSLFAIHQLHRKGLVISLIAALSTAACQPKDERPGFGLRGERVTEVAPDWACSNDSEEIAIQTRTWYLVPHSTTIWCVQLGGELYVGSYGWGDDLEGEKKYWERNVARNSAARLRIGDMLYDVTVTPVANPELIAALGEAYARKYDMADVFGDELPAWWYYRVTLRNR